MSKVVTRFAPSPTGLLHAGNYRTAVFCYLFSKKNAGKYLVRIEDTDRARSRPEYEQNILETLTWLDIMPEETPVRSSERVERHKELLKKLVEEDKAYISHEPKKDDPTAMVDVVRLRNPGSTVTFHDEIRGDITFDTAEHGNFVIARAIDDPLYHFAVVVDDGDSGITHVIRGEDHISNTPRHILIQQALGLPTPMYAHLPLVLSTDRKKLSKRRGARALTEYRDMGILPEAMLNYLAFIGWHPEGDKEYMSAVELIAEFDLARVQKGSAIFDETKLRSVNQHWMRQLSDDAFIERGNLEAPDTDRLRRVVPLLKERAQTFGEAREMLAGELAGLFSTPTLAKDRLMAKELQDRPGVALEGLKRLSKAVEGLPEVSATDGVKEALMPIADEEEARGKGGRGAVLWPLRYALSGADRSPDPFTLIAILGRAESLSRIRTAIGILEQ